MNTEALQINLAQKILSIQDKELLNKIRQLINNETFLAFDSDGNALSEKEYILKIQEAIEDKETAGSPEDVLKRISNTYNLE